MKRGVFTYVSISVIVILMAVAFESLVNCFTSWLKVTYNAIPQIIFFSICSVMIGAMLPLRLMLAIKNVNKYVVHFSLCVAAAMLIYVLICYSIGNYIAGFVALIVLSEALTEFVLLCVIDN